MKLMVVEDERVIVHSKRGNRLRLGWASEVLLLYVGCINMVEAQTSYLSMYGVLM